MKNAVILKALFLTALALVESTALASTNGFVLPTLRGQTNTQFAGWESFAVPIGAPGNAPDLAGSSSVPRLTQFDTNAFDPGSGNIYSFSSATSFNLTNSVPFVLGQVLFQARTVGSEMDYNSVRLGYNLGSGPQYVSVPRVENLRASAGPSGIAVASQWLWNLSGLGISNYWIEFHASAPSMSFDSATLDSAAISTVPTNLVMTNFVVDRWNYANNPTPIDRDPASLFGTFGDDSGVDTRLGQHLFGFDTSSQIATNLGATNYLIRRVKLTISVRRNLVFRFDPTQDAFNTYFDTDQPGYQADADAGRPIEIFGAGFRNGFTPITFLQDSDFGDESPGQRNTYVAGWSTNGVLVDVSNNTGKTNAPFTPFEAHPFAIGQTTNAAPGDLVPGGSHFTFNLNLDDPLVRQYAQEALNSGRLSLALSALHDSSFGGSPTWPDFFTHFSVQGEHPFLELEAMAVTSIDSDSDGLPDDWENFYFGSLGQTAAGDPDHDGLSNRAEYLAGTDPVNPSNVLSVVSVNRDAGNAFVVRFKFAASHQYAIDYSSDFQNWSSVENPALTYYAAPGVAEWRDDGSQTGGLSAPRYYRIRAK